MPANVLAPNTSCCGAELPPDDPPELLGFELPPPQLLVHPPPLEDPGVGVAVGCGAIVALGAAVGLDGGQLAEELPLITV